MSDISGDALASTQGSSYSVTSAIQSIAAATTRGELDSLEALVLVMYAGVWSDYSSGKGAYPSMTVVANACGISRRTAGRKVSSLLEKKWLASAGVHPTYKTAIYDIHLRTRFAPANEVRTCEPVSHLRTSDTPPANLTTPHLRTRFAQPSPIPNQETKEEREEEEKREVFAREKSKAATSSTPPQSQPTLPNPYLDDRPPMNLDGYIMETIGQYRDSKPSVAASCSAASSILRVARQALASAGADAVRLEEVAKGWVDFKALERSEYAQKRELSGGGMARLLIRAPSEQADWTREYLAGAAGDYIGDHMRAAAEEMHDAIGAALTSKTATSDDMEVI